MTPERWERIAEVFDRAADLRGDERRSYLETACAGDTELRAEVEAMLANDEGEAPIGAVERALDAIDPFTALVTQSNFGPWKVLEKLGAGGMGIVYRAERADGAFEKQAALKILHMDSPETQMRFRHERSILAGLEHPNIARLLDGGETANGSYLVMEYVEGKPLLEYAREARLDRHARLRLFLDVCGAVSYLHRNLVVHRDLKPSNILVTAEGAPKLLDFGIAKLLHENAQRTATGMFALTPQYASPEQVRGLPVTTASDVYSLGVVLYELLSGRAPYDFRTLAPLEVDRVVCEDPPPRPGLSGDLDNILMMALRKEPERRYASVDDFAEDIRRSLDNRPVRARPDTTAYRAAKYVRRNWALVAGLIVVIGSLGASAANTVFEARRAQRRFHEARLYANTLLGDFYTRIQSLSGATEARDILMRETVAYLNKLAKESEGDPELLLDLAISFNKIGDLQGANDTSNRANSSEALRNYRRSLQLVQEALAAGADRKRALETSSTVKIGIADAMQWNGGDAEAALRLLDEARAEGLAAGYPRHATSALLRMSDHEAARGRFAKSEDLVRQAMDVIRESKLSSGFTVNMWTRIAETEWARGELDKALLSAKEAVRAAEPFWKARPTSVYRRLVYRDALALHAAVLGGRAPSLGRGAEAIAPAAEALRLTREQFASDAADISSRVDLPDTARLLAPVFAAMDRPRLAALETELAAAEAVVAKAPLDRRVWRGLDHLRAMRAYCLASMGRCTAAAPLFTAAEDGLRAAVREEPARVDLKMWLAWTLIDHASCTNGAQLPEARQLLDAVIAQVPDHAAAATARKASNATLPPQTRTPTRSSGSGT